MSSGAVAGHARDGDRGADRLVAVFDGAEGPGPGAVALFVPPDPSSRTQYLPGELAQCDLWFPPADVPLGAGQAGRPPVLVMVAGYSRAMTARMIPSRQAPDPLAGHWVLISGLGAVPRSLVWDTNPRSGSGGRPAGADRGHERIPRDAGDHGDPVPAR
jgi:hypothetical protein